MTMYVDVLEYAIFMHCYRACNGTKMAFGDIRLRS